MKYQFIDQHKQEFPVVVMCRVLEVSESGFSAWRKRPTCQRKREDAQLTEEIRQEFHTYHGRYGSPRLHAELHEQGRSISRKRVARLMREVAPYAKRHRRRVLTTRRDPTHAVAPNTLNRDFAAPEPNKKMGRRHYLYPDRTRMALSGGHLGSVFTNRGRMVDVSQLR